jgi:solute:Na+ symporter, SSS family
MAASEKRNFTDRFPAMNPKGGQWCRDPHPPFAYTAVFMITPQAAAMSTMSSQFHKMGSAIGHDFMEKGMGLNKAEKLVRVIRLAKLAGILITMLTAYYLQSFFKDGATIIANGASLFFGLCAGSFLAIYALGLFWKGATKAGAHTGFLSGLAVSVVIFFFVFEKDSNPLGLCEAFFGVPSLGAGSAVQGFRSARFRGAGLLAL